MESVNKDSFGPLIAYLVPGATALLGISRFSQPVQNWFASAPLDVPTLGGFLYLTVSSIAVGMTISAVRWVTLDFLHERTGVASPAFDFSKLGHNVPAFSLLIDIHYRHYLFYSNMFVATAFAYACYRIDLGTLWPMGSLDLGVVFIEVIFFVTSRDTLKKYYRRGEQLLAGPSEFPTGLISCGEETSPENPQTPAT